MARKQLPHSGNALRYLVSSEELLTTGNALYTGWPRFGSVTVWGWNGSTVPVVPLKRGLLCVSAQFHREDGSGSGFGSWKTVPAVPVPRSVPAKTVPTVPVSGSGSVPGPPCIYSASPKRGCLNVGA